ncbi:MAG: hypothetical protein HGA75_10645 [Thiobacillus sp.]|nr:hypothetical protein [Thiobacillus sp.]
MKPRQPSPLGRDIASLLLIKVALIIAIKVVFFSDPVKPGSDGTAQALLNHTTAERMAPHE